MKNRSKVSAVIEAAVVFALVFVTSFYDVFYSFDSLLRDKLYQTPRGINNKIKIIAIDDEALREYGPFGTWSRGVYADIINTLGEYPAAVAMDIMVFGDMDSQGDKALSEACRNSGRVVAGSYISYTSAYKTDENGKPYIDRFHIEQIEQPIAAADCITGFVNASPDDDGIVRSAFLTVSAPELYGDESLGSLAAETYYLYCKNTGTAANTPTLDDNGRMWISYAGRPGDYEHISMSSLLDGSVDPRIFTDCIVLVGAYASGLQDQFSVPNSSDQMFGVEIHANIIQGLLDGKCPVPANRVLSALAAAAAAVLAYLISKYSKVKISTPIIIVMTAAYIAAGVMLNGSGLTIPILYAPLFMVICYLVNLGRKYAEEAIEKRKITAAFKKYVAPQVVEEIAKSGSYHIKLGGENRHIAVLFVDIRGFTPMSESLEPEQVVDILNSYLNLTTNSILPTAARWISSSAMPPWQCSTLLLTLTTISSVP